MTSGGGLAKKLSIILPSEDLAAIGATVDPDLFEVVASGVRGIDVAPEDPARFFTSRTFLLAATWSEGSLEALKRARRQIGAHGSADLPDIFLLEGERHVASLQSLVIYSLKSRLERDAGVSLVSGAQAERDLGQLIGFVRSLGVESLECVFASPAGETLAFEGPLSQALPVSGAGLCGFELHCARPFAAATPLRLTLYGREGKTLAQWAPTQLAEGWNRFALKPGRQGPFEDLRLDISAQPLFALSLAAAATQEFYHLRHSGAAVQNRMLAIRLYAALPGTESSFGGEPATGP